MCSQGSLISAYIDDNSFTPQISLHLGIVNGVRPLGPVLAFVLGGILLNVYEDLSGTFCQFNVMIKNRCKMKY